MPRVSSLHIIKPLNKKNKHNKFLIMIKRNSQNIYVHSNTQQLSLQPAGRIGDFGNFVNVFVTEAHYYPYYTSNSLSLF